MLLESPMGVGRVSDECLAIICCLWASSRTFLSTSQASNVKSLIDWDDCFFPPFHCRTEVPHHECWIHWSGPAGSCTGEGLHCCRWYESFSSFSPLCLSFLWLWASVRTYFTAVIYSAASSCHQVWSPHTGLQRAPQTQTCPRYRDWGWEVSS